MDNKIEITHNSILPKFAIFRNGRRVSNVEYSSKEDFNALIEESFWKKVVEKHSSGDKVEIVQL